MAAINSLGGAGKGRIKSVPFEGRILRPSEKGLLEKRLGKIINNIAYGKKALLNSVMSMGVCDSFNRIEISIVDMEINLGFEFGECEIRGYPDDAGKYLIFNVLKDTSSLSRDQDSEEYLNFSRLINMMRMDVTAARNYLSVYDRSRVKIRLESIEDHAFQIMAVTKNNYFIEICEKSIPLNFPCGL